MIENVLLNREKNKSQMPSAERSERYISPLCFYLSFVLRSQMSTNNKSSKASVRSILSIFISALRSLFLSPLFLWVVLSFSSPLLSVGHHPHHFHLIIIFFLAIASPFYHLLLFFATMVSDGNSMEMHQMPPESDWQEIELQQTDSPDMPSQEHNVEPVTVTKIIERNGVTSMLLYEARKLHKRLVWLRYKLISPFALRPIPSFKLTLGDLLIVLGFLAICIGFIVLGDSLSDWKQFLQGATKEVGKTIGSLCQALFALCFYLPSRNNLFTLFLGASFERLVAFHRWLGRFVLLMVLTHGSTLVVNYSTSWETFKHEIFKQDIMFGQCAAILLCLITLASLPIVRRAAYSFFFKLHLILIALTIAMISLHKASQQFILLMAIPLVLYGCDVLIRIYEYVFHSAKAQEVELIGSSVVMLKVPKIRHQHSQFAYLVIPSISPFSPHPFSLCDFHDQPNHSFFFIKKNLGWTKSLCKKARMLSKSYKVR